MKPLYRILASAGVAFVLVVPGFAETPARMDAFGDPLPEGAVARLGTTRYRTPPSINFATCLSPDGKLIAAPGDAGGIRLLDAADGKEVRRIECSAIALAFSPDGSLLSMDQQASIVRVWNATTGEQVRQFAVKPNCRRAFVFSGDGKVVGMRPDGIADVKALISLYDIGGKEIGTFEPVHGPNVRFVLSGDGKRMASWGWANPTGRTEEEVKRLNQTVQVWDVAAGKELRKIDVGGSVVFAADLSPDGKILAVTSLAGVLQLWDVTEGKLLRTFAGRPVGGSDMSLTFAADGKTVYVANWDGSLQAWEVESGRRLSLPEGPGGRLCTLAAPAGGKAVACYQKGQSVTLWEPVSGKTLGSPAGHAVGVAAVEFSADGKTLFSAGADGTILQWEADTGKELRRYVKSYAASNGVGQDVRVQLKSMFRFSPGGKYLASSQPYSRCLTMSETATGQEVFRVAGAYSYSDNSYDISPAAFSRDGSLLIAAESALRPKDDPRVRVWDADSGRELFDLKCPKRVMSALAVSPDGKTLAAAALAEGELFDEVLLWEIAPGKEARSFKKVGAIPRLDGVRSLGFSPDGRLLAAAGRYGDLAVWDAATGKDYWRTGGQGQVLAPAVFSPDGRLLAVASRTADEEGAIIRLWEVASGQVRRTFTGRFGPVTSLAFSPDGRVLAAGGQDTTILLWDAADTQAAGASRKAKLTADALDALWADLASIDAAAAGRAVSRLTAAPADAVPYLKKQVHPVEDKPADEAALAKLVAALDADDFEVRDRAERGLAEIGPAAAPALRKALGGRPSPELERRARELLDKFTKPDFSSDTLRLRRAVKALERAGMPEARECLEALGKGRPGADVTADARAALGRLSKRPAPDRPNDPAPDR